MNVENQDENAIVNGRLPIAAQTREVVQSGPVYDGELVDDQPVTPRRTVGAGS